MSDRDSDKGSEGGTDSSLPLLPVSAGSQGGAKTTLQQVHLCFYLILLFHDDNNDNDDDVLY